MIELLVLLALSLCGHEPGMGMPFSDTGGLR